MTLFWIICAVLLVIAILFVAIPLWRGTSKNNSVERNAANLEILRDQIAEMDADLKNGLLTPELHAQGKRELQARLLEEVGETQAAEATNKPHPLKITAVVLSILLPLASVGLYFKIGNLDAFRPMHGGFAMAHNETDLKSLEDKVEQNPDDPEAIVVLARSYVELERYADGSRMYERLVKIIPDEPILWTDYADALAMTHSSLQGAPTKLLERALELNPNHEKALALSGSAAMERGDYAAAVRHWDKLLKLLPAGDSENAKMIGEALSQARHMLAQSQGGRAAPVQISEPAPRAQAGGKERITGTVTLNAALKGNADPGDTVFVLVRAAHGPKMPLAILRKQVRDLPLNFSLDDSMAMSPEMKMSNFDQVVILARITKSGNAMPQAGDLQGMTKPLALGSSGIRIDIDQLIK
ncbi:MAG: c-type cytochrome biogenesis protein CcmI [Nitrosomonadales bacterium]|nr:c-type cytochrome biogenesis protein CcmI [Nitrosomonadales bacterium]